MLSLNPFDRPEFVPETGAGCAVVPTTTSITQRNSGAKGGDHDGVIWIMDLISTVYRLPWAIFGSVLRCLPCPGVSARAAKAATHETKSHPIKTVQIHHPKL